MSWGAVVAAAPPHAAAENAAFLVDLREGTYTAGGHTIYFQDASTAEDAAHLYAIIKQNADTGSPSLENDIALGFVEDLQQKGTLSNDQLAKFLELLDEYADEIAAFRASDDSSQDLFALPDGNTARILD